MTNYRRIKENIRFIVSNWIKWDKKGVIIAFLGIPVSILIPALSALLPKFIIESIENEYGTEFFTIVLFVFIFVMASISWIEPAIEKRVAAFMQNISVHYGVEIFEKLLNVDYAVLESCDARYKLERCKRFALSGKDSDGAWAIKRFIGLLSGLMGITAYITIFSIVDVRLVLLVVFTCALEYLCKKSIIKFANHTENIMANEETKFYYFFRKSSDESCAKDIRLFKAKKWLTQYIENSVKKYTDIMYWYSKKSFKFDTVRSVCALIRDAFTFFFLIYNVLIDELEISDFIFYFGLIGGFSNWVNSISGHIVSLKRICNECDKYREFLSLPNIQKKIFLHNAPAVINTIEFKNVSFGYEEGEKILDNISFTVKKGEKIAIVGENGAGKTTLIKLMLGLYKPTSGNIYINDKEFSTLDLDECYNHFSVVFQDYILLPTSIFSNITISENGDKKQVEKVLRESGLLQRIDMLKEGVDSQLIEQINDEATGLSGGEKQKLLLARALYKDADVLVLDEPASALDAIAEESLYENYSKLANEKISFFVSHRLTSTRFCSKIFFMKEGKITEKGTHNDLMNLNGDYYEMYNIQGIYYKNGGEI